MARKIRINWVFWTPLGPRFSINMSKHQSVERSSTRYREIGSPNKRDWDGCISQHWSESLPTWPRKNMNVKVKCAPLCPYWISGLYEEIGNRFAQTFRTFWQLFYPCMLQSVSFLWLVKKRLHVESEVTVNGDSYAPERRARRNSKRSYRLTT